MKKIVDDVKKTIKQKKILWAYPIALELQKIQYTLAIKWAVECIQIYAIKFNYQKLFLLGKYMQQAVEQSTILTPLQCDNISREIWDLPEREEIQTAIARLWGSISAFNDGEEYGGVMEITMAVELVLPDISDMCLLDQYLDAAVKIYEEYES